MTHGYKSATLKHRIFGFTVGWFRASVIKTLDQLGTKRLEIVYVVFFAVCERRVAMLGIYRAPGIILLCHILARSIIGS